MTSEPLSPLLGVVVQHCDVRAPLSAATRTWLRDLIARHKLLLFRDVDLESTEHRRLLETFGTVVDEKDDGRYYSLVDNRISPDSEEGDECIYHSDYSFRPTLLPFVSLYGMDIPANCAPTRFVSGVLACRELGADVRARLAGKLVLHASDVMTATGESSGPLRAEDIESRAYAGTLHPAILTHPATGESILFVNEYLCVRIEGLSLAESNALLADVYGHLYSDDQVYEHHWRRGDLIVFDNIALQHKRVRGAPRILRRMIVQ
jgi:taurine dioxygenase